MCTYYAKYDMIVKDMDPRRIEEDRDASLALWEMEPHMFDGTQGAAALAEWLHDMETIFRLCHVGTHLQVMLASRRLTGEARLWWLRLGHPRIPTDVWMNFQTLITLRYGPLLGEGFDVPYRDPEIYADMYRSRYAGYVEAWRAYPGGLPPEIMRFTPIAAPEMTLDEMIEAIMDAEILANWVRDVPEVPAPMFKDDHPFVPIDDACMGEPVFHGGPFMLEEPIPAVPIQEIPPQEEDADDVEMDPADQQADPEEDLEDLPVIIIASDDEDEIEEEVEEEFEEDPKEILFNDDEE
ncbi:hypothetical protein TIFTF001_014310 [Ficus carica]|uniref:Retrotransposon gag domain-containing protein n=1 Tax=Ficus carica TaxID=3494 RepID=A0AA88DIF4_FICCA|nr:hypothetical protein TIFTF001_014310 [Ficus carica]